LNELRQLLSIWEEHEEKMSKSFSLVPSENALSPLARCAFLADFQSRYFFDDIRLWGNWAFHGGKIIGAVQTDILIPTLQRLTQANHVNVKPISGLNCMTLVLASYCRPGDDILCVPGKMGGHASTCNVARILGLNAGLLPATTAFDLDLDQLAAQLQTAPPRLIYVDQANVLFPIDVVAIAHLVQEYAPEVRLHYDTSHLNGLVLGEILPNPLHIGCNSFGGSTHKTLPGPHKGYLATSDTQIAQAIEDQAAHLVSHHHMADVMAFAITMLEFEQCGGQEYVRQTVANARAFATVLHEAGFGVQGVDRGFTDTHQVWVDVGDFGDNNTLSDRLYDAGLLVNAFESLPGVPKPALRLGLNEVSRYGLKETDIAVLAEAFVDIVRGADIVTVTRRVQRLREQFGVIRYCFESFNEVTTQIQSIGNYSPLAK
jgi:glycine/serine hydroxymethyltransferase